MKSIAKVLIERNAIQGLIALGFIEHKWDREKLCPTCVL